MLKIVIITLLEGKHCNKKNEFQLKYKHFKLKIQRVIVKKPKYKRYDPKNGQNFPLREPKLYHRFDFPCLSINLSK